MKIVLNVFFIKILMCLFSKSYFLIVLNCLKKKLFLFEYLLITLFLVLSFLFLCTNNDFNNNFFMYKIF